jgi:undecaprenyl-diphosphatase
MTINDILFLKINQSWTHPVLDQFFPWVTDLHKTPWFFGIVFPLLVFFLFKKFRSRFWLHFLGFVISISVSDFLGGQIKHHFPAPRPFQIASLKAVKRSAAADDTSFYSNHASNNFCFAVYASRVWPAGAPVFFGVATLVGYSRIYNGVHFPSDVVLGTIIGLLLGVIFYRFIFYLERNLFEGK